MTLLVLHRNPLQPFPYPAWVAEHGGGVVLLAARDRIELFGEQAPVGDGDYRHIELLDDFDDEDLVLGRALELAARFEVTHVLGFHEGDVDRAALLRQKLGLVGQRPDDVLPFRDKVLMKALLGTAGVEVAPHTVPHDAEEFRAFAGAHGLPLVLKERSGFNAVNLVVIRTEEELERQLAADFGPDRTPREDLLLEAYVPGRMCHVDGLVVDGRTVAAWPSQYQYDLSSYQEDPGARIDLTLAPDDPLTDRLLALTGTALGALRGSQDYAFHAEVFHTPDDRLVFCEVAARPGGARIREVFQAVFGFNLAEYTARAHLGLPLPVLDGLAEGERLGPKQMAGQMLMMKRPGEVRRVPQPPDEPWTEYCGIFVRPGQVMRGATGSSDFLASAVLSAPTRELCEQRLRALGARFEAEFEIL